MDCKAELYCKQKDSTNCNDYCILNLQLNNVYRLSNVPARYQKDMQLVPDPCDRELFLYLKDFRTSVVDHVKQGHGLFLCSKNKGNGKTAWACKILADYFKHVALANNLRCRGLFVSVPEFLQDLRKNMDSFDEDLLDFQNNIKRVDIVIWDDIGTENPSKWVREQLYTFINHRESRGLCQIFTSNLLLEELDHEQYLGSRIVSRIKGQCKVIEFKGTDKRGDLSW